MVIVDEAHHLPAASFQAVLRNLRPSILLGLTATPERLDGQPLSEFARAHLLAELAVRPAAFSVLAFDGDLPVGLVNCIEGFSTFACQPLVNVHDLAVVASHRGRGVGQALLAQVEQLARRRGACKLTLEVLSGNRQALGLYERCGFAPYALDAAMGQAQFLQKWL
jgi:ribosomal protein S18 acetylase RimI-like enzyme